MFDTTLELPPDLHRPDLDELVRGDPFAGLDADERWEQADSGVPDDAECPLGRVMPSGWLGLELDVTTADPSRLGDADVIEAIVAFDRMASWAAARQARLLAEFARRRPGDAPEAAGSDRPSTGSRFAPDEVGLALSVSRGVAISRLAQARELAHVLPETLQAWEQGRIDVAKVRAVCDVTRVLGVDKARLVQDRVLGRASGQTVGQLRAALGRAVIAVDPEGAAERHREARKDRRVSVGQESEGMASLWALLPAPGAHSAFQWLTGLARGLGKDDPRGMDARRADLLVELLTGRLTLLAEGSGCDTAFPAATPGEAAPGDAAPGDAALGEAAPGEADRACAGVPRPVGPGKPLIQIVMPYSTLTGADDQPCELVGYGAVPADLAREIAADAVWKRLVTDPLSGALLDHGRTTYRPPVALSDFVRARDVYCRLPICRRRAIDAELDHTVAFATDGGSTADINLYGGCVMHHHLKHDAPGWTVTQDRDGRITWTTPTGHRYTSDPFDYRPEPGFPASALPPPATASALPPPATARRSDDECPF